MKYVTLSLCLILHVQIIIGQEISEGSAQEVQTLEELNDPKLWDLKMFQEDQKNWRSWREKRLPFNQLPYPVPKYKTNGIGYRIGAFQNKQYESVSFWTNRASGENSKEAKDQEVVCSIVVKEGKFKSCEIISRSHPNYVGQGYFNSGVRKIDWVATKDGVGGSIAIINGKYFNLRLGRFILVYLLEDQSMRFLQLRFPEQVYQKTINDSVDALLKGTAVKNFEKQIRY